MLRRLDLRGAPDGWRRALPRPAAAKDPPTAAVQAILADVRARGDAAVREYTERFDGVRLDGLRVPADALADALAAIPSELRQALEVAHARVLAFHRHQVGEERSLVENGVAVRQLRRPVRRAGLYVPGGHARYPSTVLMTAVPARVAGVGELALCVPPDADGSVGAVTLAAAAVAGVDEVYRVGGAQAVAAMAYGTESIPPVDVIAGPGNVYVSLAQRQVAGEGVVGVPASFAGPSEVVVVADDTTPLDYAAVDVVVQAEHGPDGLAWLITWSEAAADAISESVSRMVARSPRREEIEATLGDGGYAVMVDGPEQAMAVANAIAPEHLELMCAHPESLVPLVQNAGAVFVGVNAPASIGDYVAGPSHVLPTNGTARFAEALGVSDFQKSVHVISVDEAGLAGLGPHVMALAEAEGLAAHAESVRRRWAP
ncbi:MAG: histidinol dehydrogenase [Actinomycetota bacterium]|nr:histidinol dehydrogenase [Actinomycetota bacterium]MDQ3575249.1 histidinol dehydrogenase [Actinomycetota bacterium]